MKIRHVGRVILAALGMALCGPLQAAGMLTALGSAEKPVRLLDHEVQVTINNGFARVAVTQRFSNPNDQPVEALYATPVPEGAALAEMHVHAGELNLDGEVLPKQQAKQAYEEEKQHGRQAGLATQEGYQRYEFRVAPLPAHQEVIVSFVYYQPLKIDTGIGRFVYPLEEGNSDEAAKAFWGSNDKVESSFSMDITLKSAWPVADVRAPGRESLAKVVHPDKGTWQMRVEQTATTLGKDFVFYYRLEDNLPGRVELLPYRASKDQEGTFMLVLTPGVDLKPVAQTGADYVFVLDTSGSMQTKLHTLTRGVSQALAKMQPQDRFRLVEFNSDSRELMPWSAATPENQQRAQDILDKLQSQGSTNLYAGLHQALANLDGERVTSLVLVTDGVVNTGVIEPQALFGLLAQYDLRVFGFLMGNSSNWPLLRLIADTTGGFYAPVSNDDDIAGQLLLARSKILSEALHNVKVTVDGAGVHDLVGGMARKVYRGQQLVLFGHYDRPGMVDIRLQAALSGVDKVYSTRAQLPELSTTSPELERLWAMSRVADLQQQALLGVADPTEAKTAVRDLGVRYQIVTDETALVVMRDDAFAQRGVTRNNRTRTALEQAAQQQQAASPALNTSVAAPTAFNTPAATLSAPATASTPATAESRHFSRGGGGAAGPWDVLILLCLGVASRGWRLRDRR